MRYRPVLLGIGFLAVVAPSAYTQESRGTVTGG